MCDQDLVRLHLNSKAIESVVASIYLRWRRATPCYALCYEKLRHATTLHSEINPTKSLHTKVFQDVRLCVLCDDLSLKQLNFF